MTASAVLAGMLAAAPPSASARASHAYVQHLRAPPERVMPLLTPLGERAWASDWAPEIRFEPPGGGPGTIFVTRHAGQPDTVWLLESFDSRAGHVRYIHVTPGSDVTEIDIQLRAGPDRTTLAEVRYTWTSLGEPGDMLVRRKTPDAYAHFMRAWEEELNHYLTTGRPLQRP
jgi:hypothetical protein